VYVETFGTCDHERAEAFVPRFDFRPASIIKQLDLLRPIYRQYWAVNAEIVWATASHDIPAIKAVLLKALAGN